MNIIKFSMNFVPKKLKFIQFCNVVRVADFVDSSLALTNRAQGPHDSKLPF